MLALEAALRTAVAVAPGLFAAILSQPSDEDAIKHALDVASKLPLALPALEADLAEQKNRP